MKNNIKNIFNLSKLFIKENNNFNLINIKEKKINKKSLLYWIYIILFFAISYLSIEIVNYTKKIGKPEIFLNGFLLFLNLLIIIRTIMLSLNIFYFSKDIENILHLPFKAEEILIAKFNTILFMIYETEILFGLIPLFIYGINTNMGLIYFFNLILLLIIFPIFAILAVSILMIFLMKTIKIFKNKELMQFIISFTLIFIVMYFAGKFIAYTFNNEQYINENQQLIINIINDKLIIINKYFLNINPAINILDKKNIFIILFEFIKLLFINLFGFLIFIFLGNKLYLKQLLKAKFYLKEKNNKKINLNRKIKKNNISNSYTKKEFKLLFKNPNFFIQSIYPVIITTITLCIILNIMIPKFMEISNMDKYKKMFENIKFNIEVVCLIVGGIQLVGLLNYSSITAFSREGKNAYIIKYLPIDLYEQFIYKNIPQIFVNTICSIPILFIIKYRIPAIENKYIFIMFILSFLLIIINSFILTLIDLVHPKLEWEAEYEILKNNKNKLLQYILIIINILFLIFINNLFKNYNLNNSLIIFEFILSIIFIILNICIWRFKDKLFDKIV